MPYWQYIKQGDSEAACVSILRTATEISAFPGGAPNVSTNVVGYTMGDRWIMVSREGGTTVWPSVDKPRIDFNVYAETRAVAHDLAQVAIAVMFRAMGQRYATYHLFLTDVTMETGLVRVPDKPTGAERYIFALRLTITPS